MPKLVKKQANSGRKPAYDWDSIRLMYVKGNLTYPALSEKLGSLPTVSALEHRGAAESWQTLRLQFRQEVDRRMTELESRLQAQTSMASIEHVRERQSEAGIRLQTIGLQLAEEIVSEELAPGIPGKRWAEASLGTARMLVISGAELERRARGIEEYNINLNDLSSPADLAKYTPDQLLELLNRFRKAKGVSSSPD